MSIRPNMLHVQMLKQAGIPLHTSRPAVEQIWEHRACESGHGLSPACCAPGAVADAGAGRAAPAHLPRGGLPAGQVDHAGLPLRARQDAQPPARHPRELPPPERSLAPYTLFPCSLQAEQPAFTSGQVNGKAINCGPGNTAGPSGSCHLWSSRLLPGWRRWRPI